MQIGRQNGSGNPNYTHDEITVLPEEVATNKVMMMMMMWGFMSSDVGQIK